MKLAIMQPYFFPYIGYFSLMQHADEFILFDTPQYDRKGWMNRNRILKPGGEWQYIRAAVKKPPFQATIREVIVKQDDEWKDTVIRQLDHYKKTAPHFYDTVALVEKALALPAETLVELNRNTLEAVRDHLGIRCPIRVFSALNLDVAEVRHAGEWALNICRAFGNVDAYINPPGGRCIFVPEQWRQAGINLRFLEMNLQPYDQKQPTFEPGLSIIDIMMFNSSETIREMLDDVEIVEPAK